MPSALDAAGQPEIEVREVDDDERVGTVRARPGHQPAQRGVRSRNLPDRLGQPGDRHTAIVLEQRAARGRELRSAQAADGDLRIDRAQLAHERAGVQIAGRLAAGNQETRAQDVN